MILKLSLFIKLTHFCLQRRHLLRNEKYPHIVNVEAAKTANDEEVLLEAKANGDTATKMEEAMLRGLTKLSWERVDVNFSGSRQRFLAHNTIQASCFSLLNPFILNRKLVFSSNKGRSLNSLSSSFLSVESINWSVFCSSPTLWLSL